MTKTTPTFRFVIYSLLGASTVVFLFPLVWMFITALMPNEQAMSNPPRWLPRADTAPVEGKRIEVTLDQRIAERSALLEAVSGMRKGERSLVPLANYDRHDATQRLVRIAEPGWWLVTERSRTLKTLEQNRARDVVPPETVESSVRFRWENVPAALESMGGRSVEEIEGTAARERTGADANVHFLRFVWNTIVVCVLGVIGTVFANALIAYGFARLKWKGRDAFFAITLATMMVPFPVLMVPLFGVFKSLGLVGTLTPLWLPSFFGSAFNIFLMRQFFRSIPEELSEAARLDGCSEWRIFWRIILPLSRPVLAVAALFHFLYAWNDFLGPLLYLTRKHTFTLALALQSYQTQQGGVQWNLLMAASAVTVVPIIVLFFFAQKTFIQGIATTGSKG